MNRFTIYSIFAIWASFLFWGCTDGTTGPTTEGHHVTDTTKTPGPGDNRGTRPWAADKNIFDPNLLDGLGDPLDELLLPLSPPFLKARNITSIEVRGYADADNPGLAEAMPEAEGSISRKRTFEFSENGDLLSLRDERFLGDATPATSTHVTWTYEAAGKPSQLDFEEKIGNAKSTHQRKLNYDEQGKVLSATDPSVISSYYGYDNEKGHTYLLRRDKAGNTDVWVIGKQGDFSDADAAELQTTILNHESPFIDYAKAGNKLAKVTFMEVDGRKTLRQIVMGKKEGAIEYAIKRSYDAANNIEVRKYQWDVPNANFKTLTKYRYSPQGDLEEVFFQKQSFNGPVTNEIDKYIYSEDGLLQKHLRSTRSGQDADELVLVEYFTTAIGTPVAGTETAQPGGTR